MHCYQSTINLHEHGWNGGLVVKGILWAVVCVRKAWGRV
jgi:hypothetical protein